MGTKARRVRPKLAAESIQKPFLINQMVIDTGRKSYENQIVNDRNNLLVLPLSLKRYLSHRFVFVNEEYAEKGEKEGKLRINKQ